MLGDIIGVQRRSLWKGSAKQPSVVLKLCNSVSEVCELQPLLQSGQRKLIKK